MNKPLQLTLLFLTTLAPLYAHTPIAEKPSKPLKKSHNKHHKKTSSTKKLLKPSSLLATVTFIIYYLTKDKQHENNTNKTTQEPIKNQESTQTKNLNPIENKNKIDEFTSIRNRKTLIKQTIDNLIKNLKIDSVIVKIKNQKYNDREMTYLFDNYFKQKKIKKKLNKYIKELTQYNNLSSADIQYLYEDINTRDNQRYLSNALFAILQQKNNKLLNTTYKGNNTLLHLCIKNLTNHKHSLRYVRTLVKMGADTTIQNDESKTAVDLIKESSLITYPEETPINLNKIKWKKNV